jgi:BlaI family transcriptional regulator, penicillinase repressor
MAKTHHSALSRRERQIMDILYRRGRASVSEVMNELSGSPAYSTVRAQLRVLEEKGHIKHEEEGLRYVYLPKVPRHTARQSILKHMVDTFFEGSAGQLMAALLGSGRRLSEEELKFMEELIEKARKEGRQ